MDTPTSIPLMRRVRNRLMRLRRSASRSKPASAAAGATARFDVAQFCRKLGIPAVKTRPNSPEAVQVIRKHRIDLLVHLGGGGIVRQAIIDASGLGVLNAHMGLLPPYRGMNVTEWALWNGDPVGCTVHLIDRGIDTGDIILSRKLDANGAESVTKAREQVNLEQLTQLSEVLRYTIINGKLPPRKPQSPEAGLQYYTMHPVLVERLNQRLRTAALVDC